MSDLTSPPSIPRAVVFDLDGLMFNTEELYFESGDQILRRRGKRFSSDLADAMMGRPGLVALEVMIRWHQLDATPEQLAQETDEFFAEILPERLQPLPGLIDLLDHLQKAEFPRAIATSSRRTFVDMVLGLSGLADRFQFALTSEDIVQGKPHPEIYLKAAGKLGLDPTEILVLEDSQNGCRAAVDAGATTVAVPGPHSQHHDFQGAALVANSLEDSGIYQLLKIAR